MGSLSHGLKCFKHSFLQLLLLVIIIIAIISERPFEDPDLRKHPFQMCGSNPSLQRHFTFSFTLQVPLLWQKPLRLVRSFESEELSEQFPATSLDPFKGDVVFSNFTLLMNFSLQ